MLGKRFVSDDRGAVAIIFGLCAIILLAASGAGIDYTRWANAKTQTQAALDAAVLAAGRHLQLTNEGFEAAEAVGQAYFNSLVANRLPVTESVVDFVAADGTMAIEATATGKVETPLLGLINIPELPISAEAKAAFSIGGVGTGSNLEISLMLDTTGSMCNDGAGPCTTSTKMTALKEAAANLINIVIKDESSQTTRVALVPFSTRVRVAATSIGSGGDLMTSLTNLDDKWNGWYNMCIASTGGGGSEGDGDWECQDYDSQHVENWNIFPCVTDRTGTEALTDAAPGANAWLNAHDGGRFPLSWNSSDTAISTGLGQQQSDPASHWNYWEDSATYCADAEPSNTILPLTSDKEALIDRINSLQAYGATAGALGTAWSWYMISPNWNGIWTGDGIPGPYSDLTDIGPGGAPKLRKIAVLMTDGVYNARRSWKDQDPVVVSNNAKQICANMKAQGIEIFTVGFDLDSLPTAERDRAIDTLQTCGTDIDHFYNTLDGSELQQAFYNIALQLSTLYLAK